MARISKKNKKEQLLDKNNLQIYKTAIYTRISSKNDNNPNSINNQIALINNFIDQKENFILYETFSDIGYTGTNFERPDFQKMLKLAQNGDLNCIIVKDLSRLGRNYLDLDFYLKKMFPLLGVRFISILDNYDSDSYDNDDLILSLKNIINSLYAKDTSSKIGVVLDKKMRDGEYVGGIPMYGYMKDPKQKTKLVIDPEASKIVKEIYQLRLKGSKFSEIAQSLTDRKILNPESYKYESKLYNLKTQPKYKYDWTSSSISYILRSEFYIGNTVQGKSKKSLNNNIELTYLDKKDWIIVENTHEAIIDRQTFDLVQKMDNKISIDLENSLFRKYYTEDILINKIYCAACSNQMKRISKNFKKNKVIYSYVCKIKNCKTTSKSISYSIIERVIESEIEANILLAKSFYDEIDKFDKSNKFKSIVLKLNKKINLIDNEINEIKHLNAFVFETFSNNEVNVNEFVRAKDKYKNEIETLLDKKNNLINTKELINQKICEKNHWLKSYSDYQSKKVLNKELIFILIDNITFIKIDEEKIIDIVWNISPKTLSDFLKSLEIK